MGAGKPMEDLEAEIPPSTYSCLSEREKKTRSGSQKLKSIASGTRWGQEAAVWDETGRKW